MTEGENDVKDFSVLIKTTAPAFAKISKNGLNKTNIPDKTQTKQNIIDWIEFLIILAGIQCGDVVTYYMATWLSSSALYKLR